MDLKSLFDESSDILDSSSKYDSYDGGVKTYKSGRKIKFMRGYNDDGELIFDPFDPLRKDESNGHNVNYNKRFSKEMKQHHKLIRQQALYVDRLEKLFMSTTGLGTANPRQLTKTDVELASVLSQARGQLLQMINGVGGLKKTIADLQLKQFRGFAGELGGGDVSSMDATGAAILQNIIRADASRADLQNSSDPDSYQDLDSIDDEYAMPNSVINEKRGVQLVALYDTETGIAEPVGQLPTGEIVRDGVDIPLHSRDLTVYLSEKMAKDSVGNTYQLVSH